MSLNPKMRGPRWIGKTWGDPNNCEIVIKHAVSLYFTGLRWKPTKESDELAAEIACNFWTTLISSSGLSDKIIGETKL